MKKYLAVFMGSPEATKNYMAQDEATRKVTDKKGFDAWTKWMQDTKASITEMGSPLGKTKLVNKNGVSDTKNELGAWMVVEAESQEAAAKLFLDHPHFTIFPGDRVEVMEILAIPQM
jgi:hypothetical protein